MSSRIYKQKVQTYMFEQLPFRYAYTASLTLTYSACLSRISKRTNLKEK